MQASPLSGPPPRAAVLAITLAGGCMLPLAQAAGAAPGARLNDVYIISGASGQLGELAIREFLARGVPAKNLILVSRTPAELAEFARLGASTRFGDVDKPESLADAYKGGTRMLMISLGAAPGSAAAAAAPQGGLRRGGEGRRAADRLHLVHRRRRTEPQRTGGRSCAERGIPACQRRRLDRAAKRLLHGWPAAASAADGGDGQGDATTRREQVGAGDAPGLCGGSGGSAAVSGPREPGLRDHRSGTGGHCGNCGLRRSASPASRW